MFLCYLKYELMMFFKEKDVILWLLVFPAALGLLFNVAFKNAWEESVFKCIPTAVVYEKENAAFSALLEGLSTSDEPLLNLSELDKDEALKALEDDEIKGVFFVGEEISLTVKENNMSSTILKSLADSYIHAESAIINISEKSPQNVLSALETLSGFSISAAKEEIMSEKQTDPFVSYFYNLITMVCMFGSMAGIHIAVQNQANLSLAGARMECTSYPKEKRILASYTATFIGGSICSLISVSFIRFVLGVDLDLALPYCYLAAIIACNLGTAIGFFVGSIGKWSENVKGGICTGFSLLSCFLSGLMVANMKGWIEKYLPFVNRINPAAIITDSFSKPAVFGDMNGYYLSLVKMIIMSVIFVLGGIILLRRRRYEYI